MLDGLKDEIFEEFGNYLSLDESEAYIMDMINDSLDKFKEELDKSIKAENEKMV